MNAFTMRVTAILFVALLGGPAVSSQTSKGTMLSEKKDRARVALSHELPRLDGGHLKATVVEVHYGPGESSSPHSHPCSVIGYVLEGALRMRVEGEPKRSTKPVRPFMRLQTRSTWFPPMPARLNRRHSLRTSSVITINR